MRTMQQSTSQAIAHGMEWRRTTLSRELRETPTEQVQEVVDQWADISMGRKILEKVVGSDNAIRSELAKAELAKRSS